MARTAVTPSTPTPHDTRLRLHGPGRAARRPSRSPARDRLPGALAGLPGLPSAVALVGSAVDLGGLTLAELRPA